MSPKLLAETPRLRCEQCNLTVFAGNMEDHVNSVSHRRMPEMLSRLQAGELMSSIALDFGISRERIRQLALRHGVTGRKMKYQRSEIRKKEKQDARRKRFFDKEIVQDLLKETEKLGFEVMPVHSPSGFVYPNQVWINGYLCYIKRLYLFQPKGKGPIYWRTGSISPPVEAEFSVMVSPDGAWWIFPGKMKNTCFAGTYLTGGAWRHWHDYTKFKNAWHLLQGGNKNAEV